MWRQNKRLIWLFCSIFLGFVLVNLQRKSSANLVCFLSPGVSTGDIHHSLRLWRGHLCIATWKMSTLERANRTIDFDIRDENFDKDLTFLLTLDAQKDVFTCFARATAHARANEREAWSCWFLVGHGYNLKGRRSYCVPPWIPLPIPYISNKSLLCLHNLIKDIINIINSNLHLFVFTQYLHKEKLLLIITKPSLFIWYANTHQMFVSIFSRKSSKTMTLVTRCKASLHIVLVYWHNVADRTFVSSIIRS